MNNNVPKKIYLLYYRESQEESGEDIFWSEDRINDTDEEYYHVSEIEQLKKECKTYKAVYKILEDTLCRYRAGNQNLRKTVYDMQQALKEG